MLKVVPHTTRQSIVKIGTLAQGTLKVDTQPVHGTERVDIQHIQNTLTLSARPNQGFLEEGPHPVPDTTLKVDIQPIHGTLKESP